MKTKTLQALIILLAIEVFGTNIATAQYKTDGKSNSPSSSNSDDTRKFFFAIGISPFLNFYNAPSSSVIIPSETGTNFNGQPTYSNYKYTARYFSWEYFSLLLRFRFNIAEFSANQSLSISALPTIGLGISSASYTDSYGNSSSASGFGSVAVPVLIEYNMGNIATFSSDKDHGVVLGFGIEYVKAPLSASATSLEGITNTVSFTPTTSWVEPVFEIGYRYWNKRNKAKEFNLQLGYGGGGYNLCLSWNKYIGY